MNKDTLKEGLSLEDIEALLAEMGADPVVKDGHIVAKTVCHGGESHKLFYYDNTKLFRCYTHCSDTFDIYQLVMKTRELDGSKWSLPQSVQYVANYFGVELDEQQNFENIKLDDWKVFKRYEKLNREQTKQIVELNAYDKKVLTHLPKPRILEWEKEGISPDIYFEAGVCFDPIHNGIIIPHYSHTNELIGVRQRTIVKEDEKWGKYRPAVLGGKMYNHPLGFNLYNLNNSKENIRATGSVILYEAEKSTLKHRALFGAENDISVASCSSNLTDYQFRLLLHYGMTHLIIAYDKQYKELGDEEFLSWTNKLTELNRKYSPYCRISFLFDKEGLLDYKDSPIDKGKEVLIKLLERQVELQ